MPTMDTLDTVLDTAPLDMVWDHMDMDMLLLMLMVTLLLMPMVPMKATGDKLNATQFKEAQKQTIKINNQ